MSDPTRFPDDWVRPREFPLCRVCNSLLVDKGTYSCCRCRGGTKAEVTASIERHNDLWKKRDDLAAKRRAAGKPPKFWLKEKGRG